MKPFGLINRNTMCSPQCLCLYPFSLISILLSSIGAQLYLACCSFITSLLHSACKEMANIRDVVINGFVFPEGRPLLLFSTSSPRLCSLSNGPAMMLSIFRCKEMREICRSHLGHLLLFDPSAIFLSPLRGAQVESFPLF